MIQFFVFQIILINLCRTLDEQTKHYKLKTNAILKQHCHFIYLTNFLNNFCKFCIYHLILFMKIFIYL